MADTLVSGDSWIPVSLSEGLPQGGVMRAVIGEHDLVVWRGNDGRVRTFNNRCPHRGMRLSHGFVRGNRIACLYHGWQYDGEGACRYIPAHPDLEPPKTLCAEQHDCREFDGIVWVSMGKEAFPLEKTFGGGGIRSVAINRDDGELMRLLETALRPGVDSDQSAVPCKVTHRDKRRIVLEAPGLQTLIVSLQPLAGGRTMLHLQAADATAEAKISVSRWVERFRWFAENPASPTASWSPFTLQNGASA